MDETSAAALLVAADRAHSMAAPALVEVGAAYKLQDRVTALRRERGERVLGYSVHHTSMSMLRPPVGPVCFGTLTSAMARPESSEVSRRSLIAPRAQAGFAFLLGRNLPSEGCDEAAVLAATECVVPVLEIVDSRCAGVADDAVNVADNAGVACYVTGGRPRAPGECDWRNVGIALEKDGEIVGLAAGAAVLGHPARGVVALTKHLAARGRVLEAGSVVLVAEVTPAVEVAAGSVLLARVQDMGTVGLRCR